jgi:aminopyrrolnitrin oxygenase
MLALQSGPSIARKFVVTDCAQSLANYIHAPAVVAPPADRFPTEPASWYLFGRSDELRRGPVAKSLLNRRLVAYRTDSGRAVLMDGRCSHLGADLGLGCVAGESIQCPFHHWQYGPDGRCRQIPAGDVPPPSARQRTFPVVERHGHVWFFNRERPLFALPFFPDVDPDDLAPARPFSAILKCPWFMVGANGFDAQHFRAAHDRRLLGKPTIASPHRFARRATATFGVEGTFLRDRLTRWFAGDRVELSMDDWCGNLMFVTARFRRTRSFGMVTTWPLDANGVRVQVIVFVRKSHSLLGRGLVDPVNRTIRRYFISRFLQADARVAMAGLVYNPLGMSASDGDLVEYFRWLAVVAHGGPAVPETPSRPLTPAATAATNGRESP